MKQSGIDWIGEIPDDWKINQLSQIVSQVKNKNTGLKENNLLSLSYGKIKRKNINTNDGLLPASFDGYNIISDGDIVLRLTDLQNDHTSLRVGRATEQGIITSAYTTLHPVDYDNSKYLYYILHSFDLKKGFYGMGSGVRQGLNYDEVKTLKVPLPPKATQQRIAEYLDSKCAQIDSIIEESKKSIEEYKAWKQSVIFEAVTGKNLNCKKKDSGIEWIGEIPEDWKVVKLRNIGRCQNGISKGSEFFGKGTPFVSYGDVYRNMALSENVTGLIQSTDEEKFRYSVKRGDIFFTRTSETIEEVGIASVCLKTINNACFAGFLIRVRPFNNMIIPEFAKYYFRNIRLRDYFAKEMTLVTRASLSQNLLKELPVVVPPLTSQLSLITFLDSKCAQIDSLIAEKESLIADLTEYKKSLIFEVVTGKRSL